MNYTNEFKVGDKVRYIQANSATLTNGAVYTVSRVNEQAKGSGYGQGIYLEGFNSWWYSYRFELAEAAKPVEPPKPRLRPRHEVEQARLVEILEAMVWAAKQGVVIPDEWDDEYDNLRESLNDHYDPQELAHISVGAGGELLVNGKR